MSGWKSVCVDNHHKYWDTFSKVIKMEKLVVSEDVPTADVTVRIKNRPKTQIVGKECFDVYKVTIEYVSEDQSILGFYKEVPSDDTEDN